MLLFRQVALGRAVADEASDEEDDALARSPEEVSAVLQEGKGDASVALASVLARYEQVNLRTKPSKVREYVAVQDLLGHTLDHNILRASCSRYAAIPADIDTGVYQWAGGVVIAGKLYAVPSYANRVLVYEPPCPPVAYTYAFVGGWSDPGCGQQQSRTETEACGAATGCSYSHSR